MPSYCELTSSKSITRDWVLKKHLPNLEYGNLITDKSWVAMTTFVPYCFIRTNERLSEQISNPHENNMPLLNFQFADSFQKYNGVVQGSWFILLSLACRCTYKT